MPDLTFEDNLNSTAAHNVGPVGIHLRYESSELPRLLDARTAMFLLLLLCPLGLLTNALLWYKLCTSVAKYARQLRPALTLFGTVGADSVHLLLGAAYVLLSATVLPVGSLPGVCSGVVLASNAMQTFSVWCLLLMPINQYRRTFPRLGRDMRHARADAASDVSSMARQVIAVAFGSCVTPLYALFWADYDETTGGCQLRTVGRAERWLFAGQPLCAFVLPAAVLVVLDSIAKHKQHVQLQALAEQLSDCGSQYSNRSSALVSSGVSSSCSHRSATQSIASVVERARSIQMDNRQSICSTTLEVPGMNKVHHVGGPSLQAQDSVSNSSHDVNKRKLRRLKRALNLLNKLIALTWLDLLLSAPHSALQLARVVYPMESSTAGLVLSLVTLVAALMHQMQFCLNWLYALVLWPHFEKQMRSATLRELKEVGHATSAITPGTGGTTQEQSSPVTSVATAVMMASEPLNMALALQLRQTSSKKHHHTHHARASSVRSHRGTIVEFKRHDTGVKL